MAISCADTFFFDVLPNPDWDAWMHHGFHLDEFMLIDEGDQIIRFSGYLIFHLIDLPASSRTGKNAEDASITKTSASCPTDGRKAQESRPEPG
ncbi:hypothetical protein [Mesorhizobium sp. Cs1299R1N3]|uniref:hypothetical protein n=1 Tax=Mesorhizobium sp. Cs1299R1N3 TaxID=3015173 RepID=UPI00301DA2BC